MRALSPAARLRGHGGHRLALPVAGLSALGLCALAYVIYVLWPRWPQAPVGLDAPSLPIVVADVVFKVPPAAIRQKVQRHAGTQARIDLAYFWPSLAPAAVARNDASAPTPASERIFVTITAAATLVPGDRLKLIYPRYADALAIAGPAGLAAVAFRNGTPYQGEDLLFDPAAPGRFLVRCTRPKEAARGTCLYERLIGPATVIVRFPRDWLHQWHAVLAGIDRLITALQGAGG